MKNIVTVAAVALMDKQGRILLAQRPEGKEMAGLWEFPGGKLETGETPEDCLVRELREELGIEIASEALEPIQFVSWDYERFHLVMLLYGARTWRGAVTGLESQALNWILQEDLSTYPMPPADIPLIPTLSTWATTRNGVVTEV